MLISHNYLFPLANIRNFFNTLYTTIHSNIWNNPMPGQSPRFDPRKLRDSERLNLSNVVFLISILSENAKLKQNSSELIFSVAPSTTFNVVLVQGSGQSEVTISVISHPARSHTWHQGLGPRLGHFEVRTCSRVEHSDRWTYRENLLLLKPAHIIDPFGA